MRLGLARMGHPQYEEMYGLNLGQLPEWRADMAISTG